MIVPWTETITKESKGKIKFEIFPAMALGGKPNELYKQVRDGVVDIVWTLPGYTAGVFPRVEAFFSGYVFANQFYPIPRFPHSF